MVLSSILQHMTSEEGMLGAEQHTQLATDRPANTQIHILSMDMFRIEGATWDNGGLLWIWNSAKDEGWEPGLLDMHVYPVVDQSGFFIGLVGDKIVGCISATRLSQTEGFIGYYIVDPEERGKRYGYRLFQHALQHLSDRNIGLDGVLTQISNYEKSGFVLKHYHSRFQGVCEDESKIPSFKDNCCIYPLALINLESVLLFDKLYFPAQREKWLRALISTNGAVAGGYLESGVLRGFGVLRPCVHGYRLAPLYAESIEIARTILIWLKSQLPTGSIFYIDIPSINEAAVSLTKEENMSHLWDAARMYTKNVPKSICWNGVYGISSLELG